MKKWKKLGKFPIRDNSEFFEFQNYLKNPDPPLGSNSDIIGFENILTTVDPLRQTSEKGYLGIFILKMGILSVYILIF